MNVFELRERLISDYSAYIRSFIRIRDERVGALVTSCLDQGRLWPDPLIQLNPSFQYAGTIDDLVAEGGPAFRVHQDFSGGQGQGRRQAVAIIVVYSRGAPAARDQPLQELGHAILLRRLVNATQSRIPPAPGLSCAWCRDRCDTVSRSHDVPRRRPGRTHLATSRSGTLLRHRGVHRCHARCGHSAPAGAGRLLPSRAVANRADVVCRSDLLGLRRFQCFGTGHHDSAGWRLLCLRS